MEKQIRVYAPDGQTPSGGGTDNPGALNDNVHSNSSDESGPIADSDEDESGVDRRSEKAGALTGTDKDETGPGENMATES